MDLTVVIKDGQHALEEYDFLLTLWQEFRRLRSWLPMLSDLNILTVRQATVWTGYTILGYEARDWEKIYGEECPRDAYSGSPADRFRDAMNHGFVVYQWILLPMFFQPIDKGSFAKQRLLRVANKAIHYSSRYQINKIIPRLCDPSMDETAMIACVLYNLERCLKNHDFSDDLDSVDAAQYFPRWNRADEKLVNDPIESSLKDILPFILAIYRENGHDYVILEDDLSVAELEQTVSVLRNHAEIGLCSPVILTFSMFKYILQNHNPDLYASLRWKRELLWGKDAFFHLPEPSLTSFARQLLAGLGHALNFPQSELFFQCNENEAELWDDLHRSILNLLKMRLYLDTGVVRVYRRQWLEELRGQYSEEMRKWAEIKEHVDIHSIEDRRQCFDYIRHLADMVCSLALANRGQSNVTGGGQLRS